MMNDYCSNYTVGNIDDSNRLRALNRAIEDIHRCLGLTCDEVIFNFLYTQDNMYTNLPIDFDEPLLLYYVVNANNLGAQRGWKWVQYKQILQNSGIGGPGMYGAGYATGRLGQLQYSSTNINGGKQLIQLGANVIQGALINPYNSLNNISPTGDTANLAVDNNVWINTGGSLSFTIDPTLGNGYAGILTSGFGIMSVQQAIANNGFNKVYWYLQSQNMAQVELIMTSANGSYTFSTTTQDNGNPYLFQNWFKVACPWQSVSITGSPNSQEITSYEWRIYEGTNFGTLPIDFFRIDDFYVAYPDSMNLVYYTQYKGTDASGVNDKIILDTVTDLPSFMQFYPDFINMVALRAAYILLPQLSADKDFIKMYNADYVQALKDWGKIYPRRRVVNLGQTMLQRP